MFLDERHWRIRAQLAVRGPYLSKAIALATFHRRLDVAQKVLDDGQKLEKK